MRFIYIFLFSICLFENCFEHHYKNSYPKVYDLTRMLNLSNVKNFEFNEKIELLQHYKKNPNRYSQLKNNTKWLSVQMTFQEDQNFFRNVSKESIFFTPQTEIEWTLPQGEYNFYFSLGQINSREGYFEILENENSIHKIFISEIPSLRWKDFQFKVNIQNKFRLRWVTKNGYLFLGNPILVSEPIPKPNIILIVIDAMRRDTLGCLNSNLNITPNLDELCETSLLFTNHYSNANWTKPSMLSLFFGEYASNLGITNTGFSVYDYEKALFYRNSEKNLVNLLRKNSYFTQSIMNNVFLLEYTGVGVDLGFHSTEQIGKDFYDTEEITKASLKFLQTKPKDLPFFLHINYNTPHGPYEPPAQILEKVKFLLKDKSLSFIQKKYLAEIYYTDLQIGKILEELKLKDELKNTWIVVTSDHGEMFSLHHTFENNKITGTLYGHGQTLYDEELAIPFFIYVPETFREKVKRWVYKNPSSNISLVATVLGLLGMDTNLTKGVDYSKYFIQENLTDEIFEKVIYAEGRMMESILYFPYKYIRYFPGYTNSNLQGVVPPSLKWEEIYNIEKDPQEKENLITDTELLQNMRQKLKENLLTKNSFHILFPKGKAYSGTFFIKGEFYFIESIGDVKYNFHNRFQVWFESKGESELILYTTYPILDFELNFTNQVTKYKIGKWQIPSGDSRERYPEFLYSSRTLVPLDTSLPLLYNDGRMSKSTDISKEMNLSSEVKNILKSWGYIHE